MDGRRRTDDGGRGGTTVGNIMDINVASMLISPVAVYAHRIFLRFRGLFAANFCIPEASNPGLQTIRILSFLPFSSVSPLFFMHNSAFLCYLFRSTEK